MKYSDLASRLARRRHISKAQAADQLDGVVHRILRQLRAGKSASLPGLGTLHPGKQPSLHTATPKAAPKTGKRR